LREDAVRELKVMKELEHPNILKLHECFIGTVKNLPTASFYMVLEYMTCDLSRLLSQANLSVADIKYIFYEIVSAVRVLHENWIMHRDLKP
jgi:serine/threonine protein kinase